MAHLETLKVENYRALKDVEFDGLQPLNVLLGPNGCGKSTALDVLGFLGECIAHGVAKSLETRGRYEEVRSRGASGPIAIEIKYRESAFEARGNERTPLITYRLEIEKDGNDPIISREILKWKRGEFGAPFHFLDVEYGEGEVITGDQPEMEDERTPVELDEPTKPAIATLGQLAENPRIAHLRRFIEGWYLSYFIPDQARTLQEAGAEKHLSRHGDNLANVVQFLQKDHPETLQDILDRMADRIPRLRDVTPTETVDGRLVLQFRDGPFDRAFLSRYVSDGTLKMLAYLVLLMDPNPRPLLGIEEPENGLHPKLLQILAEELRAHARGEFSGRSSQVLVSSHSPYFIDSLEPTELWVMERSEDGFADVKRADRLEKVPHFMEAGGKLGDLWYEGFFGMGNP